MRHLLLHFERRRRRTGRLARHASAISEKPEAPEKFIDSVLVREAVFDIYDHDRWLTIFFFE